ncbi:metalloenzyme domain protein [Deinococcus sp. VB343]|uniref:metalloenzyme domain protein n=1 Tax=Deinococcus sp. VB343 TaxID=3385567 RepID=UPI0039C932CE
MSGILWLALDGVGHPQDAPPGSVWEQELPTLRPLVESGWRLDAALGVPGLPQSGTGQSCWLTGQDAVRLMGEHFGPVPGPTLQALLRERGLPRRLHEAGARAALVNRYAPAYLEQQASGRNRLGCFPFTFRAAGLALNPPGVPLLGASLGLSYASPWLPTEPESAVSRLGRDLAAALRNHDLLVADLWVSDLLGHQGRDPTPPDVWVAGRAYLRRVDLLLGAALDAGARVILSSDHGNLEDLSVKTHTRAGVPLAVAGLAQPEVPPPDIVAGGQWVAHWVGLGSRPDP